MKEMVSAFSPSFRRSSLSSTWKLWTKSTANVVNTPLRVPKYPHTVLPPAYFFSGQKKSSLLNTSLFSIAGITASGSITS